VRRVLDPARAPRREPVSHLGVALVALVVACLAFSLTLALLV